MASVNRIGYFEISYQPKYLVTIKAILKTSLVKYNLLWLLFGQLLKKLGMLFIQTSGHTGMANMNENESLILILKKTKKI